MSELNDKSKYEEIEYLENKIGFITDSLKGTTQQFEERIKNSVASLEKTLVDIKQSTVIFYRLPDEIAKDLDIKLPMLAKKTSEFIMENMTQELDKKMKTCSEMLLRLNEEVDVAIKCVKAYQNSFWFNIKNLVLLMIVCVLTTSGTMYLFNKYGNHRFSIDSKGQVNIHNSKATIWGDKNLKVLTIKEGTSKN